MNPGPPRTREAGPPRREPAPIGNSTRRKLSRIAAGFKHQLKGLSLILAILAKTCRIVTPHLPGLAWMLIRRPRAFLAVWRVVKAQRAVRLADQRRIRERRWKP